MSASSRSEVDAFHPHDHGQCQALALATAEALCKERNLRLTPARAFVLGTLHESHKAMTAYELLDRMAAAGLGSQPPVVYRALDFLVENGFVHRIERLGAFVGCVHGGEDHRAAFLVCRLCRAVAETHLPRSMKGLGDEAAAAGFTVEQIVVEAEGICAQCRVASE